MFYDLFKSLCDKKGVSVSRACIEMGLSRSIAAKWKNTKTNPSAEVIPKIAQYFNVSTDYLLGNEKEDDATSYVQDDPEELIILNRAAKKMTPEKRKKLLEMAKIMFAEDFKEDE